MRSNQISSTAPLFLLAAFALSGCDARRSGPDDGGSGSRIVLSLQPTASLIVGRVDSDALDRVRGVATTEGRLAVANAGSRQILVFDTAGSLLQRIGRDGEGPGEFRSLSSVHYVRGDSLLTFDSRLQRFSVFSPEGSYVRAFRLSASDEEELVGISVLGLVQDSIIIIQRVRLNDPSAPQTGTSRALIDVLRARLTGELLDTMAVVQGWEAYGRIEGATTLRNMPVPFGRSSYISVADHQIVVALSDSNVVRVYRPDGTLAHVIRSAAPEGPAVTAADIARFKATAIENAPPGMRQQLSTLYDRAPMPGKKPPFTWIYAGRDSTIWIRARGSDQAHHFLVFSTDGRRVGEAHIPLPFSISEVDLQGAVGVWTDSLGVETVRRYNMKRVR